MFFVPFRDSRFQNFVAFSIKLRNTKFTKIILNARKDKNFRKNQDIYKPLICFPQLHLEPEFPV